MNYGLYLSASGMMTGLYRMDVAANNLANANTVGFKPDLAAVRQRDVARVEDGLTLPSNGLLEKLGAGVLLAPNRVSTAQGSLQTTGNPLDLALEGNGYFVVRTAEGSGPEALRLSRDGRLALDPRGRLVQAASGRPVVDLTERPIFLDRGADILVEPDGTIRQGGEIAARLQIADIADPARLRKDGDNLLNAPPELIAKRQPGAARVTQRAVEQSAVDPVRAMLDVNRAERAVSAGGRMITIYDEILSRAIGTFAKVA